MDPQVILICAVSAGVAISRDYAAQVQQRERQAAELALQAADLESCGFIDRPS